MTNKHLANVANAATVETRTGLVCLTAMKKELSGPISCGALAWLMLSPAQSAMDEPLWEAGPEDSQTTSCPCRPSYRESYDSEPGACFEDLQSW